MTSASRPSPLPPPEHVVDMKAVAPLSALLSPGNFSRIARGTGYKQQHISRFLRGMSGCSFDAAVKIARASGVTMDQLRDYVFSQRPAAKKTAAETGRKTPSRSRRTATR